ncbi:hypothetical protein Agub_g7422, partial [Astrephomene gubernaculifera]
MLSRCQASLKSTVCISTGHNMGVRLNHKLSNSMLASVPMNHVRHAACIHRGPLYASAVPRHTRHAKTFCLATAQILDGPHTLPSVQLSVPTGDVLSTPDACVQVAVRQPSYAVQVLYRSRGRPLEGAVRVWAHIGHSGWRDTQDVELSREEGEEEVWRGTYHVPVARLTAPWRLEVQLVFRGRLAGAGAGGEGAGGEGAGGEGGVISSGSW